MKHSLFLELSAILSEIEARQHLGKNIDRIQKIVDGYPYNFSHYFLIAWIKLRDDFPTLPLEKGVKVLMENIFSAE